jgi:hypothetical protein
LAPNLLFCNAQRVLPYFISFPPSSAKPSIGTIMSLLRAKGNFESSPTSTNRSFENSANFEQINDSKLNYSTNTGYAYYDEEREKLRLEVKELKDMVELQDLERIKLLKRLDEEKISKREEKKLLFKQIEKLKRDTKEPTLLKENLTASSLNNFPDFQEKTENVLLGDNLKNLKFTAETERRQENTLISQLDEMFQIQISSVSRQLQDERMRCQLLLEKIEILSESHAQNKKSSQSEISGTGSQKNEN